jgi:hypothetical protein
VTRKMQMLVDTMPSEAVEVIRKFGCADMDDIAGRTIDYLKAMRLIERTKNLLTGELIWVLTADGKRVRKILGVK